MAHAGEKPALRLGRSHGLISRDLELRLVLLVLADVGVDRHRAAAGDPPLIHLDPAVVAAMLDERYLGIAVSGEPRRNPFILVSQGILDQAALYRAAENGREWRARNDRVRDSRVEDLPIATVAEDEPILCVIEREAFGNALDRVDQTLARLGDVAQALFLDFHSRVPKKPKSLRHAADLVTARFRERRAKVAAGDRQHALAERRQTAQEVSVDV
jgi:hypothetical protein